MEIGPLLLPELIGTKVRRRGVEEIFGIGRMDVQEEVNTSILEVLPVRHP